jgi:hypothetical protein
MFSYFIPCPLYDHDTHISYSRYTVLRSSSTPRPTDIMKAYINNINFECNKSLTLLQSVQLQKTGIMYFQLMNTL